MPSGPGVGFGVQSRQNLTSGGRQTHPELVFTVFYSQGEQVFPCCPPVLGLSRSGEAAGAARLLTFVVP